MSSVLPSTPQTPHIGPDDDSSALMSLNDTTCQELARAHHDKLVALESQSHLVQFLLKCGAHCPGITIQGFLPAMDTATDTLIGNTELVYAVGADKEGKAVSVIRQPVGVNAGLIAPCARSTCSTRGACLIPPALSPVRTGAAKTWLMEVSAVQVLRVIAAMLKTKVHPNHPQPHPPPPPPTQAKATHPQPPPRVRESHLAMFWSDLPHGSPRTELAQKGSRSAIRNPQVRPAARATPLRPPPCLPAVPSTRSLCGRSCCVGAEVPSGVRCAFFPNPERR